MSEIPIDNPENMIQNVQELLKVNLESAVRTLVMALINRKEYEMANSICDKMIKRDRESEIATRIRAMKQTIRNAEIGEAVIKFLNMDLSSEEKISYFERIENGINTGNVKPRMVYLYKGTDNSRRITLADIWEKEIVK